MGRKATQELGIGNVWVFGRSGRRNPAHLEAADRTVLDRGVRKRFGRQCEIDIPFQQFLVKVSRHVRVDFDTHFRKLVPQSLQHFWQPGVDDGLDHSNRDESFICRPIGDRLQHSS